MKVREGAPGLRLLLEQKPAEGITTGSPMASPAWQGDGGPNGCHVTYNNSTRQALAPPLSLEEWKHCGPPLEFE